MKPEDIAELKQLIEFLKENQVAEFDLDRGDLKIRLKFVPQQSSVAGLGLLAVHGRRSPRTLLAQRLQRLHPRFCLPPPALFPLKKPGCTW